MTSNVWCYMKPRSGRAELQRTVHYSVDASVVDEHDEQYHVNSNSEHSIDQEGKWVLKKNDRLAKTKEYSMNAKPTELFFTLDKLCWIPVPKRLLLKSRFWHHKSITGQKEAILTASTSKLCSYRYRNVFLSRRD